MESKTKKVKNGTRIYLINGDFIEYLKMIQKQQKNMEFIVRKQKVEELKK